MFFFIVIYLFNCCRSLPLDISFHERWGNVCPFMLKSLLTFCCYCLLTPSCLHLLQGEPYQDEGGQSVGGYGDVFFFFYHVQRTIYKRNMPDSSRCYIKISFFYFFKINCRKFCIIQIWDKYMFNCSFIQNKKIREINLFSRNA